MLKEWLRHFFLLRHCETGWIDFNSEHNETQRDWLDKATWNVQLRRTVKVHLFLS